MLLYIIIITLHVSAFHSSHHQVFLSLSYTCNVCGEYNCWQWGGNEISCTLKGFYYCVRNRRPEDRKTRRPPNRNFCHSNLAHIRLESHKTFIFESSFHLYFLPVPVAARSKAQVCCRLSAEIVGSNPAGSMDVCLL